MRCFHEISPFIFLVGPSLGVDVLDGCASKIMKGLLGIPSFGSFVAGVKFGPGFFEEHDPELAVD